MASEAALEMLEALGLEPGAPTVPALHDLFTRFQARVRHAKAVAGSAPGPRTPDEVFAGHLEDDRGAALGERTGAFLALAEAAGLPARLIPAELAGRRHTAVLVELPGGAALCDVAFPLPEPLTLAPGNEPVRSPWGDLLLRSDGSRAELRVDARGRTPVRARYHLLECAGAAVTDVVGGPCLLALLPDRVLRYRGGRQEVLDAWSRLTYPLPADEAGALRQIYGQLPEGDVVAAAGSAPPLPAVLSVYHRSERPATELLRGLATPAGLLALHAGGARMLELEPEEGGWRWRVESGPGERVERVRLQEDGLEVRLLEGELPFESRRLTVEPDGRLVYRAAFGRALPPQGLAEPVRKTLVFHLASELLQLAGS